MIDEKRIMLEVFGCLARTWVLSSAPNSIREYIYVDGKWVEITIKYNGEMDMPRRRAEDHKEIS